MSCGKVMGHGLYCSDGYECSVCQEIKVIKEFISRVADLSDKLKCSLGIPAYVWKVVEEAQSIVDKEAKLPPSKFSDIVSLGRQMTGTEAIQYEEDMKTFSEINKIIKNRLDSPYE